MLLFQELFKLVSSTFLFLVTTLTAGMMQGGWIQEQVNGGLHPMVDGGTSLVNG